MAQSRPKKATTSTRFHGEIDKTTALALKELRSRIDASDIVPSVLDTSINIATWNIREFGKKKRTPLAIHLIAEIISRFDLVAMVELRDNLEDMRGVLALLGDPWKLVYSDVIDDAQGNHERVGFLYDSRSVHFTGLAAEANPVRKVPKNAPPGYDTWWRSPYMASFRASRFDFVIMAVHIRWGSDPDQRLGELQMIADFVKARRESKYADDRDIVVVGDFNIPSRNDKWFAAVTSGGLRIPKGLAAKELFTNLKRDCAYDQILYYPDPKYDALYRDKNGKETSPAGVVDFAKGGLKGLFPGTKLSEAELTYQLSDHLPLWFQLQVWSDDLELSQILRQ